MDEIELNVYNRRVILKQDTKFRKENYLYVAAAVVWELEKVTNRLYEKRRVCVFALCTFF